MNRQLNIILSINIIIMYLPAISDVRWIVVNKRHTVKRYTINIRKMYLHPISDVR